LDRCGVRRAHGFGEHLVGSISSQMVQRYFTLLDGLKRTLLIFLGPVINVEHHMLGREDAVVNGVETSDSDSAPNYSSKKAELDGEVLPMTEVR
jgi:hypothetical protein